MMLITRKLLEGAELNYLWLGRAMIIVLLLILGFEPFVAAVNPLTHICYYRDTHMNKSTYKANLELLSTALFTSASSTRTDQDCIYGIVVCRGDGVIDACPSCITTAF